VYSAIRLNAAGFTPISRGLRRQQTPEAAAEIFSAVFCLRAALCAEAALFTLYFQPTPFAFRRAAISLCRCAESAAGFRGRETALPPAEPHAPLRQQVRLFVFALHYDVRVAFMSPAPTRREDDIA